MNRNFAERPLEIFLADDDADDRSLFEEAVLETKSLVKLTTVESGSQLMELLSEINEPPPPDLIFLDINMPGKTGKVCLREIRSNRKFDRVPIIMFSTSSFHYDIDETYKNGANLYVCKSVFFEDEINALQKLFSLNWQAYLVSPSKEKFIFSLE